MQQIVCDECNKVCVGPELDRRVDGLVERAYGSATSAGDK